jgi:hypothetical protein
MAQLRGRLIVVANESTIDDTPLAFCGAADPIGKATQILAALDLISVEQPKDVVVTGRHDVLGEKAVFCVKSAKLAADEMAGGLSFAVTSVVKKAASTMAIEKKPVVKKADTKKKTPKKNAKTTPRQTVKASAAGRAKKR